MHISFVILHYLTIEDTIQCIESIQNNIDYDDYSIVIVDNGSKNNTGKILADKYDKVSNIKVILNDINLGFAKGNNIGFQYAKDNLNPDFIVMINNDTIIKQKEFCNQIIKEYNNIKFDIAGPKIISLIDNQLQNPIPVQFKNKEDIKRKLIKFKVLLMLNYIGADTILQTIKRKIKKNISMIDRSNLVDYQLHGSCLIFSKNYVKNYEGLYPETFMYCEEDILKYISIKDNLFMTYLPSIEIYHKEDSATDEVFKKDILKRRFYYRHSIKSCIVLKNMMKK
ncbi:glycosyltransferase family 2 protein [Romboutsia ilealis]|uniref:glycosyltransferase family 2 protein n=1 Tax=Romboutsia ilealis TaxID=1115758 RepID=UPI00272D88C3|nr:glycosyltransferase [Romboutsia ilealis]